MDYARTAVLVLLAAVAGKAHAGEPASPFDTHPASFVQLPRDDAFIVGVCNRDRATLLNQMRHQRTALQSERDRLRGVVGNGHLNARDIAITILMPGGLLYAAQRHDRIRQAETLLPKVDARLQELSAELRALGGSTALSAGLP